MSMLTNLLLLDGKIIVIFLVKLLNFNFLKLFISQKSRLNIEDEILEEIKIIIMQIFNFVPCSENQ